MIELREGSPLWRAYQTYKSVGGDTDEPEIDTLGHFARKIIIWLPVRAIFLQKVQISAILVVILVILASFWLNFGQKLALFALLALFFADIPARIDMWISVSRPRKIGENTGRKALIRLMNEKRVQ